MPISPPKKLRTIFTSRLNEGENKNEMINGGEKNEMINGEGMFLILL